MKSDFWLIASCVGVVFVGVAFSDPQEARGEERGEQT